VFFKWLAREGERQAPDPMPRVDAPMVARKVKPILPDGDRGLNAAICRFYGLPDRGDADTLAERAKDAVLSLKTSVFLVDDIHFLAPSHADTNAVKMANHLKFPTPSPSPSSTSASESRPGDCSLRGGRRSRRCRPSSGGGPRR
jgi:hypothetical protein